MSNVDVIIVESSANDETKKLEAYASSAQDESEDENKVDWKEKNDSEDEEEDEVNLIKLLV